MQETVVEQSEHFKNSSQEKIALDVNNLQAQNRHYLQSIEAVALKSDI